MAITFEESGERVYAAMLKVFAGCCVFIICILLLLPPSLLFSHLSFLIPSTFHLSPFTLCFPLPSLLMHTPPLSQHHTPDVSLLSQPQNGPNWILFNIASLYWRVVGDPASAVECLRRAVHFAPSSTRDVGYIGLANVLHKQGFLNEAVIVARTALDISGVSVSEL